MSNPRFFYGNFDFEDQLAHPRRGSPSRSTLRRNAELASSWLPLARDGDFVWFPELPDDAFLNRWQDRGGPRIVPVQNLSDVPPETELIPWGASLDVAQLAAHHRWRYEPPPFDAVRAANSRGTSWQWETDGDNGLPGSAIITSLEELAPALKQVGENWILKAEFSASGRERISGTGTRCDETQIRWLERRLKRGQRCVLEPRVNILREAGLQWHVPRSGSPQLLGVTDCHSDRRGQYRGNAIRDTRHNPAWAEAIPISERAARQIQQLGYFGPLGIDVAWYAGADGTRRLRPLQDINARYTMGRLALGWSSWFPDGVLWRHGTAAEFADRANERGASRVIRTSPERLGELAAHHASWIEC